MIISLLVLIQNIKKQQSSSNLNNETIYKLNTSPPLRNILLNHIDNYYNNELKHDLSSTTTTFVLLDCITKQTTLGWRRFIRGRLSSSFHPIHHNYFRSNKLGNCFKYLSWYRNIIQLLWQLHHTAWLEYCDNIHSPTKLKIMSASVKKTLLTLVDKYKTETDILPKCKKICFSCTKLQYLKWSTKELQRRLDTTRKIL